MSNKQQVADEVRKIDMPKVRMIVGARYRTIFLLIHKGRRHYWHVIVDNNLHVNVFHKNVNSIFHTVDNAKAHMAKQLQEIVGSDYTCDCGSEWTESELYAAVDNNEDAVTLMVALNACPDCYEGDLP